MPHLVEIGGTVAEMTIFARWQPSAIIFYQRVRTTNDEHLLVFIAVQNLVGIGAAVLICIFFDFASVLKTPIGVLGI